MNNPNLPSDSGLIRVDNIQYDWELSGYNIVHIGDASERTLANCAEGYRVSLLANNDERRRKWDTQLTAIEQDMLEIHFVGVAEHLRGRRLAQVLVRHAVYEAQRRGFSAARADLENERMVSVLDNLYAEGTIRELQYHYNSNEDDWSRPPTALVRTLPVLSSQQAKAHILGEDDVPVKQTRIVTLVEF
jgi:GNAT superfamily N-acetyltransferase